MPKIILPDGTIYRYKTIPLFPGVKRIDRAKAAENLRLFKTIADASGLSFSLAYGTVLGAMREHDFIDHDEDIDLALFETERSRFLSLLPRLREAGFELVRHDRRGLYSIMRRGEYIDFYFFAPFRSGDLVCSGFLMREEFLKDTAEVEFAGDTYRIPRSWERYLIAEYGEDWRTPVEYNDYSMPGYKRVLFSLKEHLKDLLPDGLFMRLARKAEQASIATTGRNLKRLDEYDNRK